MEASRPEPCGPHWTGRTRLATWMRCCMRGRRSPNSQAAKGHTLGTSREDGSARLQLCASDPALRSSLPTTTAQRLQLRLLPTGDMLFTLAHHPHPSKCSALQALSLSFGPTLDHIRLPRPHTWPYTLNPKPFPCGPERLLRPKPEHPTPATL